MPLQTDPWRTRLYQVTYVHRINIGTVRSIPQRTQAGIAALTQGQEFSEHAERHVRYDAYVVFSNGCVDYATQCMGETQASEEYVRNLNTFEGWRPMHTCQLTREDAVSVVTADKYRGAVAWFLTRSEMVSDRTYYFSNVSLGEEIVESHLTGVRFNSLYRKRGIWRGMYAGGTDLARNHARTLTANVGIVNDD